MYDTVDTFQVACAVPVDEAKIFLDALTTRYPDYVDKFSKFIKHPSYKLRCTFRQNLPIGIKAINLYRHVKFSSTVYIVITVQPEALCSGYNTNRVFRCTPQNVYALQLHYANAIYDICPDAFTVKDTDDSCRQETFKTENYYNDDCYPVGLASLPYLGLLITKRVDYSINICDIMAIFGQNIYRIYNALVHMPPPIKAYTSQHSEHASRNAQRSTAV